VVTTYDSVENGATGNATTIATGSADPTVDVAVVVTGLGYNDTAFTEAINSGFTISNDIQKTGSAVGGGMAYKIVTDGSAQNPTWSGPGGAIDLATTIAVFR